MLYLNNRLHKFGFVESPLRSLCNRAFCIYFATVRKLRNTLLVCVVRQHTGSCGDQLSAVGLVASLLRIGARSGVRTLIRCPLSVCTALGARSVRMRVANSTANVGLCIMYVCMLVRVCVYVNMYFCVWCRNSSSPNKSYQLG